jgi:DNA transposition AAA+ family ATPase
MKNGFCETNNWNNLNAMAAILAGLTPDEPRIGLVYGHTGLGKTMAAKTFQARHKNDDEPYVYVRALDVWSPTAMLKALAGELAAPIDQQKAATFGNIVSKLESTPQHIIIDEADYLVADKHLLNTIRDLHDKVEISVILVGEERLHVSLQHPSRAHFLGRVAEEVAFHALTAPEIKVIARRLCEVRDEATNLVPLELTDEQAHDLRTDSKGEFRQVRIRLRRLEAGLRSNKGGVSEANVSTAIKALRRAA